MCGKRCSQKHTGHATLCLTAVARRQCHRVRGHGVRGHFSVFKCVVFRLLELPVEAEEMHCWGKDTGWLKTAAFAPTPAANMLITSHLELQCSTQGNCMIKIGKQAIPHTNATGGAAAHMQRCNSALVSLR